MLRGQLMDPQADRHVKADFQDWTERLEAGKLVAGDLFDRTYRHAQKMKREGHWEGEVTKERIRAAFNRYYNSLPLYAEVSDRCRVCV